MKLKNWVINITSHNKLK